MSNLRGVIVAKGAVGANVENLDGCSALLVNGPVIAAVEGEITGLSNGTVYLLESVRDAENMGITAEYDEDNSVRVYRHITEFYRMAGEGTKLYLLVAEVAKDMDGMLTDYGQTLVNGALGEIRLMAVGFNPASGYTATYVNGLETSVSDAIEVAQELADWAMVNDKPLHIMLEGRGIDGLVASMEDLRAIEVSSVVVEYNNVSICIGQDYDYAETLTGVHKKMADVGTLLGTKAGIQVHQNLGEVETLDISDAKKEIWLTPGLSNHTKISAADSEDLQDYNDKGYIFGISYTGITGVRWNDDHVCAPVIIDADGNMNVHSIALSATLNKLARLIRLYLLPKVKTTVPVDTETGKLPVGIVKYFEGIGNQAFIEMLAAGEISGGQVIVDPDSDLMTGDKELITKFNLVPIGTIGQISATINVKKTL